MNIDGDETTNLYTRSKLLTWGTQRWRSDFSAVGCQAIIIALNRTDSRGYYGTTIGNKLLYSHELYSYQYNVWHSYELEQTLAGDMIHRHDEVMRCKTMTPGTCEVTSTGMYDDHGQITRILIDMTSNITCISWMLQMKKTTCTGTSYSAWPASGQTGSARGASLANSLARST